MMGYSKNFKLESDKYIIPIAPNNYISMNITEFLNDKTF